MENLFYQENFESLQPSYPEPVSTAPRMMPFSVLEFGEPLAETAFDHPPSPRHFFHEDAVENPSPFFAPLLPQPPVDSEEGCIEPNSREFSCTHTHDTDVDQFFRSTKLAPVTGTMTSNAAEF